MTGRARRPRQRVQQDQAALRQLCLLRELTQGPRSSRRLRDKFAAFYGGTTGRTTYDRDIRDLRQRALVETGHGDDAMVRRTRIHDKPERLHLSADEHRALRQAREARTGGPADTIPLTPGQHGESLDLLLRLLRDLEEATAPQALGDVARRFLLPVEVVYDLLDMLFEDLPGTGIPGLELRAPTDLPDEILDNPPPEVLAMYTVDLQRVDGRRHSAEHPTRGRGLDIYGGFAYNLAEIDERLDLIAWALDQPGRTSPDEREHLRSAASKLSEWRHRLSPMSDLLT